MRQFISIKGAKENNLKNIDVEIPRDKLVVLTGLSGSGKSSLAFDTLYAEGQRRFMESLSAWARRFVQQQKRPKVDSVLGLSPVISIEQKTINKNPRSTVGTMTDIYDYLRLLFCSTGEARCLYCDHKIPIKSPAHIVEHILSLPEGTAIELCAPVFKVYGEDYAYVFNEVRTQGCRRVRLNGEVQDISDELEMDEMLSYEMEAIVDKFVVKRQIQKQLVQAIGVALKIGNGFLRIRLGNAEKMNVDGKSFFAAFACPDHHLTTGELEPWYFSFNEPDSACPTCSGLGTYLKVHTGLLVPDPSRSLRGGAFVEEAFRFDKESYASRIVWALSVHHNFSLDTPFRDLSPEIQNLLFYGTKGEKVTLVDVPGSRTKDYIGKQFRFDGFANNIERHYRNYRKKQTAHSGMEDYLRKVMVENDCPDCGGTRLKKQRLHVTIGGKTIHEMGQMPFDELADLLRHLPSAQRNADAGAQVNKEITTRLDLLVSIGLDYLNLNRRAGTLSGGESQRIRLSTQISSELMGMLYVLDEPSIGLHPKDNEKLIHTLRQLRDIGNTVIVVEHDEDTIRAADHVIEIGPGPGVHGGTVVSQGTPEEVMADPHSLTGSFLSGKRAIDTPERRRPTKTGLLTIRGARENNLQNIDIDIPLGVLVCVTGASGSGKSTVINDILYKKLYAVLHDSRVLPGAHDGIDGIAAITDVINIDQSPIGRSPRSNPATYIGFYDDIRNLFASTQESQMRGYTMGRFSFNVKGGRCEECAGEGIITTSLNFMPDVETECPACKGARYNAETLEVTYRGKNIAEILALSIEEGTEFFADQKKIVHKLNILNELGLGYLTLGHSAPTLSGGEAQRVKLANELGKIKRGQRNLYILDEPTTGLHLADIQRLLDCLTRLVNAGNSVVVIEHHLDVIKTADWVIDLGPEGGKRGGRIVAEGTPEVIARCAESHTGRFLRPLLSRV
jgi:excinuclease ABC subunit A